MSVAALTISTVISSSRSFSQKFSVSSSSTLDSAPSNKTTAFIVRTCFSPTPKATRKSSVTMLIKSRLKSSKSKLVIRDMSAPILPLSFSISSPPS